MDRLIRHPNWSLVVEKFEQDRDSSWSEEISYQISSILGLECIGNGSFRGVYRKSPDSQEVFKIALNSIGINDIAEEVNLLLHVPMVIKTFFLPFNQHGHGCAIMPQVVALETPTYDQLAVMKERYSIIEQHILLPDCDPDDKPWNWGLYQGMPVVLDFAEWEWREK